ncbi:MAG: hypothetical protein WBJ81_03125 [Rickettsiales bacterium]
MVRTAREIILDNALFGAIHSHHYDAVPNLLSRGASANAILNDGFSLRNTPLHALLTIADDNEAQYSRVIETARVLIEAGADPLMPRGGVQGGMTALDLSLIRANLDGQFFHMFFQHLLGAGRAQEISLLDERNFDDRQLMTRHKNLFEELADNFISCNVEGVRVLLNLGVNPNGVDAAGNSLMHFVHSQYTQGLDDNSREEIDQLLSEHGYTKTLDSNQNGDNSLEIAIEQSNEDMINRIIDLSTSAEGDASRISLSDDHFNRLNEILIPRINAGDEVAINFIALIDVKEPENEVTIDVLNSVRSAIDDNNTPVIESYAHPLPIFTPESIQVRDTSMAVLPGANGEVFGVNIEDVGGFSGFMSLFMNQEGGSH